LGYENLDIHGGSHQETSDIVLATVELAMDADIVDHVQGHILFLHEEDDTPIEVDEGIITIDGEVTLWGIQEPAGDYTKCVNTIKELRDSIEEIILLNKNIIESFYVQALRSKKQRELI